MTSEIKLLQGRALFISQDIHELRTKQTLLRLPFTSCIRLVDPNRNPLDGNMSLFYRSDPLWKAAVKTKLPPSDFVFSEVPERQQQYHPSGSAAGYCEPQPVYLTYKQLKNYHYHILEPSSDILEYLSGWPSYGYSFSSRYWITSAHIVAYPPCVQIAIYSRLWTYWHDLTLTFGLKEYQYPYPREEWITQASYPISYTPSPPHEFLLFSPAPSSIEGTHYHITHQIPNGLFPRWEGIVTWWPLPASFIPP